MRSCSAATSAKSLNCLPKTKKINKHRLIALNSHSQVLLPWKRGRNPYAVFSICSTSGHYDLYLDTTTCCVWLVNKVRDVIMIIWKQITCSIEKIVRSSVQKTCVKMNDFPSQCNFLYVYKLSSETLKNASDYWKPPVRLGMWIFSITWCIQKTITGGKNFWGQYIMS